MDLDVIGIYFFLIFGLDLDKIIKNCFFIINYFDNFYLMIRFLKFFYIILIYGDFKDERN